MHWRTEVFIDENPEKIDYESTVFSLGSGFSDALMAPLRKYRFDVESNPYGTIYNPLSIFNLLHLSLGGAAIDPSLVIEQEGVWNHFDFHFKAKATSREALLERLQDTVTRTRKRLQDTDVLILTFGTAYVYQLSDRDHIVANCHKTPPSRFDKRLLSVRQIVDGFREVYARLNHVREIVLVVSPIMHTKASVTLNAVSKSVLRLACHEIMNEFPHVKYFPAYEFLLDDLRDYRFYKRDLIHPNDMAMDYIFRKFADAYIDAGERSTIDAVEEILEAIEHVPYNPQSEDYQATIRSAIDRIREIGPRIDLSALADQLQSRLR